MHIVMNLDWDLESWGIFHVTDYITMAALIETGDPDH